MTPTVIISALLLLACGDKDIEPTDGGTTGDGGGDDGGGDGGGTAGDGGGTVEDYFEPVAIGIGLSAGWDAATNELLYFSFDGKSAYPPYLTITFADMDYFSAGSKEEQEAHRCRVFALFDTAEATSFPTRDYETGATLPAWAMWEGVAEFDESLMEDVDNCYNWDPSVYPGGTPIETFSGMRVGIGLGPMSSYLKSAWNEKVLEEYGDFMLSEFIAINHPTDSGYEFVGYNWVTAILWEMDLETLIVESDEKGYLVGSANFSRGGFIGSYPYWYEDFPNLDLSLLRER